MSAAGTGGRSNAKASSQIASSLRATAGLLVRWRTVLEAEGVPCLAVDADADNVAMARKAGSPVLYGNVSRLEELNRAHVERGQAVVITMDAPVAAEKTVGKIRQETWPDIPVCARAREGAHATRLDAAGVAMAVPETSQASLRLAGRETYPVQAPARRWCSTGSRISDSWSECRSRHEHHVNGGQLTSTRAVDAPPSASGGWRPARPCDCVPAA